MIYCPHCGVRVIFGVDGRCPACGTSRDAAITADDRARVAVEADRSATWDAARA